MDLETFVVTCAGKQYLVIPRRNRRRMEYSVSVNGQVQLFAVNDEGNITAYPSQNGEIFDLIGAAIESYFL